MCGIAGFFGEGGRNILSMMTKALQHRGPDNEDFFIDEAEGVFLGHRRLSILDLAGGNQPMSNETGTIIVVFNGEIYNHRQLRSQIEKLGHRFRTDHSDTEVLVHGYKQWGAELPQHLNGMFAFVVLDRLRNKALLARDRFGEKPLFFSAQPNAFVFASEVKTARLHPSVGNLSLSPLALRKYFGYGFFPAPLTPYQGLYKLPHGHVLELDLTDRTWQMKSYWHYSILSEAAPPGTPQQWAEEVEHLLVNAVKSRMESDVPLGVFLSGGIDSSAILSAAAESKTQRDLQAFSIGFQEPSYDESLFASTMAKHVGAKHLLEICNLQTAHEALPELLTLMDEPLGDSSILPTYLLCRFAAQHVRVALSGDGGDELFGGYDPFRILTKAHLYHRLVPTPIHQVIAMLASKLPVSDRNMSFQFKLNRGLRGLNKPPSLWNPMWLGLSSPTEFSEIFAEPIDLELIYSEAIEAWDNSKAINLIDRSMEFYANFYLPDGVLVKSDRASMLNSLEVRAPFLDNDLVEFARRLPTHVKLRHGKTKWILRQAMQQRLPTSLLERPKKGFGMPITTWLRQMPTPKNLPQPFGLDTTVMQRMWTEHVTRKRDRRGIMWGWLTLTANMQNLDRGLHD